MYALYAHTVCAALLGGSFAHVDPTLGKGFAYHRKIVIAKRSQSFKHQLASLFVLAGDVGVLENGHVQIVHVERFHTHQLFAQCNVAMQRCQRFVRAFDKIVVHGLVHMFVKQSHFHRGSEVSCLGTEPVGFNAALVNARKGVDYVSVPLVVVFKRKFANCLVLVLQQHAVRAVTELHFFAVDGDLGEVDIAAVHAVEYFVELSRETAHLCHQLFFNCGQDVRFAFQQVGKSHVVVGKIGVGNECFKLLVGKSRQLRRNETCGFVVLCQQSVYLAVTTLARRILTVLVVSHVSVAVQLFQFEFQLVGQLE